MKQGKQYFPLSRQKKMQGEYIIVNHVLMILLIKIIAQVGVMFMVLPQVCTR